eukprot:30918-Pelagococcus_subviridis.AAC.30
MTLKIPPLGTVAASLCGVATARPTARKREFGVLALFVAVGSGVEVADFLLVAAIGVVSKETRSTWSTYAGAVFSVLVNKKMH